MSRTHNNKEMKMLTDEEKRAEVRTAALVLDEHKPDWYLCINPERLNMMSVTRCIAGQNGLDYHHYVKKGFRYAFSAPSSEPLWLEEIEIRKVTVPDYPPVEPVKITA